VAVLETGRFAAAARLDTSSGEASKLVARLGSELGGRLLNRTTRAATATEAGRPISTASARCSTSTRSSTST
jgi:DNA-binding transcriptional LysR family regulator